jgi:IS5 family transposase
MTRLDPYPQSPESIDHVRRTRLARAESRPSSKLRPITPEDRKPLQRASGRLRTAAWRCNLDRARRPESDVVGLALLAAVATWPKQSSFDPASVGIVSAAFGDLISRGYDRHEIEQVFKRFRSKLYVAPDLGTSNDKVD